MSDEAMPDDLELEPVAFGDLLQTLPMPNAMHRVLWGQDQMRANTFVNLMLPTSGPALPALEMLLSDARLVTEFAVENEYRPEQEFAERVENDLHDAIDGLLLVRESKVLESCRDLMELTVLFRDFRRTPARFLRWQRIPEGDRLRAFGFEKLLRAYPQPLPFLGPYQDSLSAEYSLHSRTLHPAMYAQQGSELSRGVTTVGNIPLLIGAFTAEICRHTASALWELVHWLLDLHGKEHDEMALGLALFDEHSAADEWMTFWRTVQPKPTPEEQAVIDNYAAGLRRPKKN